MVKQKMMSLGLVAVLTAALSSHVSAIISEDGTAPKPLDPVRPITLMASSDPDMSVVSEIPPGDLEFELSPTKTPELNPIRTPVEDVSIPVQISVAVDSRHPLPSLITVNGHPVFPDQAPVILDGVLMVPIRFIAEEAGGKVVWYGDERRVHVVMPDRTVNIYIGEDLAEMHQHGGYYFQPNLVSMERPAVIMGGRTMISADALTSVFGLGLRPDTDENMDLLSPLPTIQPVSPEGVPAELADWASGVCRGKASGSRVAVTQDGTYVCISGGVRPTGGYRVIISDAVFERKGTLVLTATVIPPAPTGVVTQVFTTPVGYFYISGFVGEIKVRMADETMLPLFLVSETFSGTIEQAEAGRILVTGPQMINGEPERIYFYITDATHIVKVVEGEDVPAAADNLLVGALVEVEYSGPVLESYPTRAVADVIRILK